MKTPINVMIIDDHREYRETIKLYLGKEKDLQVCGAHRNAIDALRVLQEEKKTLPNVILLDLNLPGISGLEAIPWLRKVAPQAKILVLSLSDAEDDVFRAIQAGAVAYLLKSSSITQIKTGIRAIMNGEAILDPSITMFILKELQGWAPESSKDKNLTTREREILEKIAEGCPQKEIASHFEISIYTVAEHLSKIYAKLQVQNAPAAISQAFRKGILK